MKLLDSWTTCLIFDVKHLSVETSQGAPGLFPFLPPRPRLDMEQPCSLVGPCRSWQALPCPLPRASSSHTVAQRTYSAARRGTHVRPGAPHRALPSHPPPSGTLQPARPPDPPSRFTALQLPSLHFLGISQQNLTLNFTLKVSISKIKSLQTNLSSFADSSALKLPSRPRTSLLFYIALHWSTKSLSMSTNMEMFFFEVFERFRQN